MATASTSHSAYTKGKLSTLGGLYAYLCGWTSATPTSKGSYLFGNQSASGTKPAYSFGGGGEVRSRRYAYIGSPLLRSSLKASMEGLEMSVSYIWLKTDDVPTSKAYKFRVLAQDYDDGTPEKAETLDRTIGGGIDHSVGGIYVSWSPIIRVRHTESETDYGTLADLDYFYRLNNPNGTPSDTIVFIDHMSVEHNVHITGTFQKSLLGVSVEGSEGWYLVRLKLVEI